MKLTLAEAEALLLHNIHSHTSPGALERLLSHEWSFDPRGGHLRLLMRRYHEQDQLFCESYTDFRKITDPQDPSVYFPALCVFCALTIRSVPCYTALNPFGSRWNVCCDCHDAIHLVAPGPSSLSSPLLSCCSLDPLSSALSRCLSRFRRWFRRPLDD